MTPRLDTTDLLEKRVRSRFGGRTINVWPEDVWTKVMRRTLLAGLTEDTSPEAKSFNKAWKQEVDTVCSDKKVLQVLDDRKTLSNVVRTLHNTTVSIVDLLATIIANLTSSLYSTHSQHH
jgi:origin recognition complex subunit 4